MVQNDVVTLATFRTTPLGSPENCSLGLNKSPLIAFAGGTIAIAVMVLAAFANMAGASEQTCPRSQSNTGSEQLNQNNDDSSTTQA